MIITTKINSIASENFSGKKIRSQNINCEVLAFLRVYLKNLSKFPIIMKLYYITDEQQAKYRKECTIGAKTNKLKTKTGGGEY